MTSSVFNCRRENIIRMNVYFQTLDVDVVLQQVAYDFDAFAGITINIIINISIYI